MSIQPEQNDIYPSLADGLRDQGIPSDNHEMIRRFCEAIGIETYLRRPNHIKAVRRNGGPELRIHWGWTRGFTSAEEIHASAGDHAIAHPSSELWYVEHPVNRLPDSPNAGSGSARPGYGTCLNCFMERAADGSCNCG